jgi:hypothetical protein
MCGYVLSFANPFSYGSCCSRKAKKEDKKKS